MVFQVLNLGGISSYCLYLLVIAFFKESKMENNENLTEFIMEFLNFYGNKFNPKEMGISLFNKPR